MQLEVILPLVAYLVVVFGISVYAMRKRSTGTFLNEYFLGSRSMGGIVLAMTLTATYISASSFIGGPGAAYKYGLGWVLLAMIQLPAVWLSLGILGKKFAILARRYNAVTLNDMLFARYQSRLLVWLASLSLLVAFVGAMTVQFIGGARLLETAAGIPYETGLLIFGISIALYTAFGGFRASVLNDTMQGLVMLIGTIVLLIGVVHAAGGLSNADAKRVMMGVWSFLRQFMYTKFVIVCDDDVNARDWNDVIWAITTRMDPARDTVLVENTPIDYLDFASPVSGLGSKMGLDATNKWPGETQREWGRPIKKDPDVVAHIDAIWDELAIFNNAKSA